MVRGRKKIFFFLAILTSFLFLTPKDAFAGFFETGKTYLISNEHPRIFITKRRLHDIRERCADKRGAQAKYYRILKKFGDEYSPTETKPSAYHCLCLAFLYLAGEIPGFDYSVRSIEDYGRLGAEMLTKILPPSDLAYFKRYTPDLVACYDWLYSAMTASERATVFLNFTSVCDKMRARLEKSMGNRWRGTREMFAYYGLAFYGDGKGLYPENASKAQMIDQKSQDYVEFFNAWHLKETALIFEAACKEGANPDGTMYGEAPYPSRLWPMDAWRTASNDNLYEYTTYIDKFPLFWLHNLLPYSTNIRYDCANGKKDKFGALARFGDYRYIGYTALASRHLNTIIALSQGISYRQGKKDLAAVFNWMIQQQDDMAVERFGGPYSTKKWVGPGPHLVWDIVFRQGLVEAESPQEAKLPLSFFSGTTNSGPPLKPDFPEGRPEGAGVVTIRSSWDDPGGTLVWFKASSHMLSHSHRDQGSFQIYKKGWLAIDSGQYEETTHRGNYSVRTVAHNSILVYRPDERLNEKKVDPVWYGYGNDGGQRWVPFLKSAEMVKDDKNHLGGIACFERKEGIYDYVHADITRAYNSTLVTSEGHDPKVSLVARSLLFLRPEEFVILFDRVTSTDAEYPKRWLLHSIYRPELDGEELFDGIVPYSRKIPGKRRGVKLTGDKTGGISKSTDTHLFTLRGWDFGPSDGRLVCRTLRPEKHIVRVVGGGDTQGTRKTKLVKPYKDNPEKVIFVEDTEGFHPGDFVYLAPTEDHYSKKTYGHPHWPVDDVFYRGWGKIEKIDKGNNSIKLYRYRSGIPQLPAGTTVLRSNHANDKSFEFMDAEYTQWAMHGESVANAGPFHMQHGAWRVEVEPVEKKKQDFFLHVMLPCDKATVEEAKRKIKKNIQLSENNEVLQLIIVGDKRKYRVCFEKKSNNALLEVEEQGEIINSRVFKSTAD